MNATRMIGLAVLLSTVAFQAQAQSLDLAPGPYAVGYRVDYVTDPARSFGPRQDVQGNPRPRPLSRHVQVHTWYPAESSSRAPMLYRDYVIAGADPMISNRAQVDAAEALSDYKAHPLLYGADEFRLDAILLREMHARRDAVPRQGSFPLIIYAPSINSDPRENAVLFEHLASHGYVIASAPSVGLQEPEVGRDRVGAIAQVGDLRFVLTHVWGAAFVDRAHIGVLGYSWGGLTGLLFALQHRGIDAIACFDGAYAMVDYRPVAESFDDFLPRELRAAMMEVVLADQPRQLDFAGAARYADTYSCRIPGIRHRDLGADQIWKYRVAMSDPDTERVSETWQAIAARAKTFFDAYLKGDASSLRSLREDRSLLVDAEWISRCAMRAPPTAAQFDGVIEQQGVAAAVELFRALRRTDPDVIVFDEDRLLRYAMIWGAERSHDLLPLLELNLEAYPASAETHFWLGQVHLAQEDESRAIEEFRTTLTLDPDHARARKLLDRLTGSTAQSPK